MKLWGLISIFLLSSTFEYVNSAPALAPSASFSIPPPPPPSISTPNTPCFSGMYNPCGLGSCITVGTDYRCICPKDTRYGERISGDRICVPDSSGGLTYNTTQGDLCYIIAITFRLTIDQLRALNPTLDCDNVVSGLTLNVNSSIETSTSKCWIRYTVTYTDTCSSIVRRFQLKNIQNLTAINPALDCTNLFGIDKFLSICIRTSKENSKFYVCRQYVTPAFSSSRRCRLVKNSARRTQLYNPGLNCGRLSRTPKQYCLKAIGYSYFPTQAQNCGVNTAYLLTSTDTCASLYLKFAKDSLLANVEAFKNLNSGMDCNDKFLFVGQRVCLP